MSSEEIVALAEKAQPLAEEVVRQYVLRAWVGCGLAVFFVGIFAGAIVLCGKKFPDPDTVDDPFPYIIGFVLLGFGLVVAMIFAVQEFMSAIAPLPGLLGK